jgi:formate dehydrogenase major subunit
MAKNPDFLFAFDNKRYPYVATTYRVSEHWQTGVMTRHLPWQLEMQPQMFVEIDRELGEKKGIKGGDKVIVKSARGEITCAAIVTNRFTPLLIQDTRVHLIGMPWCFGWQFPEDGSGGDSANLLTPFLGDPGTLIPESKAFMVDINRIETVAQASDHPAEKTVKSNGRA